MVTPYAVWKFVGRYKYPVTIMFFLVLVCFIGDNSLMANRRRGRDIEQMRSDLDAYRSRYVADSAVLYKLTNDPKEAERVARELYHMRREREDIYLFAGNALNTDSLK